MTSHEFRNGGQTKWIRTNHYSIFIDASLRSQSGVAGLWMVEAFVRSGDGLYYRNQLGKGKPPEVGRIVEEVRTHGQFSPRPCSLEQAVDPSMGYCALAQFHNYCDAWGVDAIALLDAAYPDGPSFKALNLTLIANQADWEGITYPRLWGTCEFSLLVKFLKGNGYDELAEYLNRHPKGSRPRLS